MNVDETLLLLQSRIEKIENLNIFGSKENEIDLMQYQNCNIPNKINSMAQALIEIESKYPEIKLAMDYSKSIFPILIKKKNSLKVLYDKVQSIILNKNSLENSIHGLQEISSVSNTVLNQSYQDIEILSVRLTNLEAQIIPFITQVIEQSKEVDELLSLYDQQNQLFDTIFKSWIYKINKQSESSEEVFE